MRSIFAPLAVAAALAAAAAPTYAKSPVAPDESETVVLTPTGKGKLCTPGRTITGSIIPHRICKTRADWIADGVRFEKSAS